MPSTREIHGLVITDHEFALPLDHARSDGETITVFAREVAAEDGRERPFLVFLQGGPGREAAAADDAEHARVAAARAEGLPRAAARPARHRPFDARRRAARDEPRSSRRSTSKLHRADAIVRDAERIRQELGVERWSVLGQSFGGFCACTYLSIAPGGLREAFFTGGLPPIAPADRRRLPRDVRARARAQPALLRALPGRSRARARDCTRGSQSEEVLLPSGDRLTRGASASSARCSG